MRGTQWHAERLTERLMRYRSSDESSATEEHEPEPRVVCPPGCKPVKKRKRRDREPMDAFTDGEMAAALEITSRQTSQELEGADFTPFGRKLSWQQLAQGCVVRLAADLLQLRGVAQAAEWADLLHHRLEARRAASVRTTNETQQAIDTLHALGVCLRELERLRDGAHVADVIGALGRASVVKRRWEAAAALAPSVRPRTPELVRLVREAVGSVLRGQASPGTKAAAQRVEAQWAPRPAPPQERGERIAWDSD